MGDNEIWCLAWRLLVKHQGEVDAVIAREIEQCLAKNDTEGADYWLKIAEALNDFR